MARPSKKAEAKKQTNSLLVALDFVALAQRNIGTQLQTHCIIRDGWCVASDNVLTMGVKVPDELNICPQTARFAAALRRCSDTVSITQLDNGRISVKSGAMRVVVPCVEIQALAVSWADPTIAPLGEVFRDACRSISHLAADGGTAVHLSSLLGRGQTLSATTGRVLVEYWHGFDTPPYWVLPKPAITALLKVIKPLTGFGFSGRSATFYFEDGSWLKTQLFEDKWPNTDKLFETDIDKIPVTPELFNAINVISDFAEPGSSIKFKTDKIELVAKESEHAEFEVKGLKEGPTFSLKDLQQISKLAVTMEYGKTVGRFTGERLRGCISVRYTHNYDDDVPF